MVEEENPNSLAAPWANRRATSRQALEEDASLLLVKHGSSVACRVLDLSLGGCRVQTSGRILASVLAQVEVSFKVHGLTLRFRGITQWTDDRHQIGICFVDVTSRRREELAELVCELEGENTARAEREAAEARATEALAGEERLAAERWLVEGEEPEAKQSVESAEEVQYGVTPTETRDAAPTKAREAEKRSSREPVGDMPAVVARQPAPMLRPRAAQEAQALGNGRTVPKAAKSDRRVQSRFDVDTSALIYLINVGSRLQGRIVDLSASGCRIRTNERFPVGIYTRVETEFHLEGLPLRVGGVIQAIHDRQNVGIRFLDMSDRKRTQVEQLIVEIEETSKRRRRAE